MPTIVWILIVLLVGAGGGFAGYTYRQKMVEEKINRSEEIFNDVEKFLPIIWKYTDIQELNAHILNELIEKIVVHEKTVNPDGSKSQRVDIHYKFIGYIDTAEMLLELAEEVSRALDIRFEFINIGGGLGIP